MPQLNSIILKDGASPVVNHTYAPRDVSQGVGTCIESTGIPVGENVFTVGLKRTANGHFVAKVSLRLPQTFELSQVGAAPNTEVIRVASVDVEFKFHAASTETERRDAMALIASALLPTQGLVNDTVVKLQGVY